MLGGEKLKRIIPVVAILMVVLMITPSYASAEAIASFDESLDFGAISGADEVQNSYDPNAKTNIDTWDPVPQGVWFGGYPLESLFRIEDVPDENFQIALTTVCRFGSDIIMSGAARTLVRLPVLTGADPWTSAKLNIYKISAGSNWTFSKIVASDNFAGAGLNDMKINFTSGTHELVFWSEDYDPTDVSPTDENDHFTRTNRTYVFVDAPIAPNQAYLFVTYVWYDADKYVDFYLQPDPLDSEGNWNRSDVAVYNKIAPDAFTLNVHNLNVSLGYSFDFRNGFGNSAYGLNIWCDAGDTIEFFSYVDLSQIDINDYLTLMVPFRSSVDNVSFDVLIQVMDMDGAPPQWSAVDLVRWDDYICRDFILLSMPDTWTNNETAIGGTLTNWFKIILYVNNDTRIWLPMWDEPKPTGEGSSVNASWNHEWVENVWDSDAEFNYNLEQWVQHESAGHTGYYNYHWSVQHALQFNNYQWVKDFPATSGIDGADPIDNMTLTQKLIFANGWIWFKIGDALILAGIPGGTVVRSIGVGAMIYAQYSEFPDFVGRIWDTMVFIADKLHDMGVWLWRAAQKVFGVLEYFVDLVIVVVGILILLLAFSTAYVPTSLTLKGSMAMRKFMLGDIEGAVAHLDAAGKQATGAIGAVTGGVRKLKRPPRPGGQ